MTKVDGRKLVDFIEGYYHRKREKNEILCGNLRIKTKITLQHLQALNITCTVGLNSKKSLIITYKHQPFLADTCAAWTNRGQIY